MVCGEGQAYPGVTPMNNAHATRPHGNFIRTADHEVESNGETFCGDGQPGRKKIPRADVLQDPLKLDNQSQISFLRRPAFRNFIIMDRISNRPNSCPKTCGRRPRITTHAEDRYIAVVAKQNRRATSSLVTYMVAASIDKMISATIVHQRLPMKGLRQGMLSLCSCISSIQRGTNKVCRQYVNWIMPC
ncbi:HTH_Tnp_Tc3_2 domain-containing protein [Caerostris darwini]|uniref:HTH_Tnp_Tc3_2 domain-containing protein n=1 Tax=Caerostris darwini TaxID=1538125 RepID=A0AAV4R9P5_9ARAC|nr:HTH_Tnp_Tc3_2 domain-containing protein [Caerostris darwini]